MIEAFQAMLQQRQEQQKEEFSSQVDDVKTFVQEDTCLLYTSHRYPGGISLAIAKLTFIYSYVAMLFITFCYNYCKELVLVQYANKVSKLYWIQTMNWNLKFTPRVITERTWENILNELITITWECSRKHSLTKQWNGD